jgi:predicted ATPase with chaperone activity
MQIFPAYKSAPTNEANNIYLDRAREIVFAENPDVCAYIFGHTHDAFLVEEERARHYQHRNVAENFKARLGQIRLAARRLLPDLSA